MAKAGPTLDLGASLSDLWIFKRAKERSIVGKKGRVRRYTT